VLEVVKGACSIASPVPLGTVPQQQQQLRGKEVVELKGSEHRQRISL